MILGIEHTEAHPIFVPYPYKVVLDLVRIAVVTHAAHPWTWIGAFYHTSDQTHIPDPALRREGYQFLD